MANKRDYYEVLGVDKNADESTLKKAYYNLHISNKSYSIHLNMLDHHHQL